MSAPIVTASLGDPRNTSGRASAAPGLALWNQNTELTRHTIGSRRRLSSQRRPAWLPTDTCGTLNSMGDAPSAIGRRVVVSGMAGSGKSTFSRSLAVKTSLECDLGGASPLTPIGATGSGLDGHTRTAGWPVGAVAGPHSSVLRPRCFAYAQGMAVDDRHRPAWSAAGGVLMLAFIALTVAAWQAGQGTGHRIPEPAFALFVTGVVVGLYLMVAPLAAWSPYEDRTDASTVCDLSELPRTPESPLRSASGALCRDLDITVDVDRLGMTPWDLPGLWLPVMNSRVHFANRSQTEKVVLSVALELTYLPDDRQLVNADSVKTSMNTWRRVAPHLTWTNAHPHSNLSQLSSFHSRIGKWPFAGMTHSINMSALSSGRVLLTSHRSGSLSRIVSLASAARV
jgi:hypothetical protein